MRTARLLVIGTRAYARDARRLAGNVAWLAGTAALRATRGVRRRL